MNSSPTIVLTGATAGIGKATAQALYPNAGTLILIARNESKLNALKSELEQSGPGGTIDLVVADLSEAKPIQKAIEYLNATYKQVDILINNAGGIFNERKENSAGYEYTLALNHLGYFQLTNGIIDLVTAAPNSRIVNVSSAIHTSGSINFDDLMMENKYSSMKAYAQSKLANILFTIELADQVKEKGTTVNSLHPGVVDTDFSKNMPGWMKPLLWLFKFMMIKPEQGAETSIYLATSPEVEGVTAEYFTKKAVAKTSPAAKDRAVAKKLWTVSEELIEKALA